MTAKRPKKKLRKDTLKNQETTAITAEVAVQAQLTPEDRATRDVNMFKGWLMGKTYAVLASENDLSEQSVWLIAKKYNWRNLRKELRNRQFNAALERVRDLTIFIQDALEADVRKLVSDAIDAKRGLNKEERDHLRAMYDRTLKEIRLDEGKPTEIGGGPVQVEIVLPAGAKRFGVIPPDPKVKVIEATKEETNTVDLDSVEDDVKGKIK